MLHKRLRFKTLGHTLVSARFQRRSRPPRAARGLKFAPLKAHRRTSALGGAYEKRHCERSRASPARLIRFPSAARAHYMPVPICRPLQHHIYRRIRAPINTLCVTSEVSEYTSRCMNRIDDVRGFDSLGGRRLAYGINAVEREQ